MAVTATTGLSCAPAGPANAAAASNGDGGTACDEHGHASPLACDGAEA